MAFPENFIQELIDRNDIVDVIGSYVNLSKRSGANLFGLCPFHNERTPSFAVNPSGQFYHCFGCGKGGGVINFIMEIENLSYPDAVRHLAARAGMEVPDDGYDKDSKRRARLLELNRDAAKFFYEQLSAPDGQNAVRYMRERGISPQTAKRFGLGCAPDSWESLRKAMAEKGYSDFELFDAGLVKRGQRGGFYDTFRNRLMFPVIDVRGDVIGFSGRILGGDGAKYMNSPDTLVYNKSRNLFAIKLEKKSKNGYLLLVEGNVDVVTLHQAGQKAAQRAIGILERLDLKVRVLRMTGAKDPDEFIRMKGADAFANLLKDSENQVDYRLNTVKAKYDLSLDDQKVSYLKEASELLASLPGQVERQVYAIRVAGEAGIGQDAVIREVERRRKILLSRLKKDYERDITRPEKAVQPAERTMRYSNPGAAAAEEGIIRLLYLEPALVREELPDAKEFSSEALGKIYSVIKAAIESGTSVSVNALAPKLAQEEMNLLVRIIQKPERLSESRNILADYVRRMREEQDRKGGSEDLKALSEKLRKEKGFRP